MSHATIIIISSIASLLAVRWIYFWVLKVAKIKGVVDNPGTRKLHKVPIPVMGGSAVFFGILAGSLISASFGCIGQNTMAPQLMPVVCSMAILYFIGWLDDMTDLRPITRLILEIIVVGALIMASGCAIDDFGGLWSIGQLPVWVSYALTVFASVGIINAINMVDGVNALASSICIMACLFFGCKFLKADCLSDAVLAFCAASSILPFVIHNLFGQRSRMFLGDAGTMTLGLLLSYFAMRSIGNGCVNGSSVVEGQSMIAFSLAVLSLPVFDALRVMTIRICNGKSPFVGDKTHLHHLLVALGFGHLTTTICEIGLNLLVIASWQVSVKLGAGVDAQFYTVVISAFVLIWGASVLLQAEWFAKSWFIRWLHIRHEQANEFRTRFYNGLARILDAPEDHMFSRDKDQEQ